MYFFIDTHVLVWYLEGNKKLPLRLRKIIDDETNQIIISVASLWELAIKIASGKLDSDLTFPQIQSHILQSQYVISGISYAHLNTLMTLPNHHGDTFDRMLIAQAISENLAVISIDKQFKNYDVTIVW